MNKYDGYMPGLLHHNGFVPARRFQYQLATMYGTSSKDIVGVANMQYNIFPKTDKIKQLTFGLGAKSFNYRQLYSVRTESGLASPKLQYRRLTPYIRLELMASPKSNFYQTMELRSLWVQNQVPKGVQVDSNGSFIYDVNNWADHNYNEFAWELGDRRALNPYRLRLALEQGAFRMPDAGNYNYLKLSLEANMDFSYANKRKIYTRLFFGKFLNNGYDSRNYSYVPVAFNMTAEGYNDYRYDDYYFGRTENSGIWSQQIHLRDGGFKVPLGYSQSALTGRSNDFLFAINLKADLPKDLPLKLPIRPYFDFGYFKDDRPISNNPDFSDQVWWQGGVALELGKGIFGIYLPIVNSKLLRGTDQQPGLYDLSGRDKWYDRFAFTLDLNKLNPWKMADSIKF
jgi:hypothetical protein